MSNSKIAYVILHYKNADITIKCLNNLINVMGDDSAVIVVDNNSQNESLNIVKKSIGNNNKIHYIYNTENIGFARGNNLGYRYAKNVLKAVCIVVMNNDIYIKDSDFEKKLLESGILDQYSIIAPDVVTLEGKHQNPFRYKKLNILEMIKSMILQYIYSCFFKFDIVVPCIVRKYSTNNITGEKKISHRMENIVPHGSCVIFTSIYIQKENFAFVPVTYFYGEEDLLYDYAVFRKYKIIYYPDVQVIHVEKQSTQSISKNQLTILKFRSINKAKSIRMCLIYRMFPKKFNRLK